MNAIMLQGLLKKVYQESCRILNLSQLRATTSSQPHVSDVKVFLSSETQHHSGDGSTLLDQRDKSTSNPPMSWQQEKRALQETVIALRELLCRMAQRQPQVSFVLFNILIEISCYCFEGIIMFMRTTAFPTPMV